MTKITTVSMNNANAELFIYFSNGYHYHITFDDVIFAADLAYKLKVLTAQIFKDVEEGVL